ncbi:MULTISPECIES: response regulator transcription factor [Acidithrix]|uniref:Response regulator MprA n=1 Tax=Acidithrix ferrooxidans TaxID=1280514 RepID=A0A0D8HK24_9ACTN|nr:MULTISPECIES: response regulator transcription factor [Acidithrix]KJF18310.1 response regulator MprA [Acidithrix ferrooxidans]CAG4905255.1 unnamed protein product [Acidithrix sp. C25]
MQKAVSSPKGDEWIGRVLLVEDDLELASALARRMEQEYYRVTISNSGELAIQELSKNYFDILILDILLPGMSGLEVCKIAVQGWPELAILMITSLGGVEDVVNGLELGADDYLVKPFGFAELKARLHAILRRGDRANENKSLARSSGGNEVDKFGDLALSPIDRSVTYRDNTIILRPREFEILDLFLRRPGVVLTRRSVELILQNKGTTLSNATLDWHIHQLRRKLQAETGRPFIKTIYCVGWCLDENWND